VGLHGVADPFGAGHHHVVDGHGEAARLGLAQGGKQVGKALIVSNFVRSVVYEANHATSVSWDKGSRKRTSTFPFASIIWFRFGGYCLSLARAKHP
jgi:hypothetical protein